MSDERSGALANELRRRGLDAPAIVLLHAHRPLRPLLGDLAVLLSPLARPLGGMLGSAAEALREDAGYDQLIEELEAPERR